LRYLMLIIIFLGVIAAAGKLYALESGSTFDPYDDLLPEGTTASESDYYGNKKLSISTGLIHTSRSNFEDKEMKESNYYTYLSAAYAFSDFLYAGFSVPYLFVRYEDYYEIIYENGIADVQSFARFSLPEFSTVVSSITATVQWPTGTYERFLGTGEFSFGVTAAAHMFFGPVYAGLTGSYFYTMDPPEVDLPDTKTAGLCAGFIVNEWLAIEAGAEIYNTELITREQVYARQL